MPNLCINLVIVIPDETYRGLGIHVAIFFPFYKCLLHSVLEDTWPDHFSQVGDGLADPDACHLGQGVSDYNKMVPRVIPHTLKNH